MNLAWKTDFNTLAHKHTHRECATAADKSSCDSFSSQLSTNENTREKMECWGYEWLPDLILSIWTKNVSEKKVMVSLQWIWHAVWSWRCAWTECDWVIKVFNMFFSYWMDKWIALKLIYDPLQSCFFGGMSM